MYEVEPLPDNPTVAQIRNHKERKQRKSKAKATFLATVSSTILARIMTLKTTNKIWDFLKQEYEGNEKVEGMQVLNFIREFEMQRMKESETIKEYSNRLLGIVNNVRLLGTEFLDARIVQKIIVTKPEKFEAIIASLDNLRDLSSITLAELLNALQAQEQRRLMRQKGLLRVSFKPDHRITKEAKQYTCLFTLSLLQKKYSSTQQVLVGARHKMSQVWSIRTCGKNMQDSTTTRRSQGC